MSIIVWTIEGETEFKIFPCTKLLQMLPRSPFVLQDYYSIHWLQPKNDSYFYLHTMADQPIKPRDSPWLNKVGICNIAHQSSKELRTIWWYEMRVKQNRNSEECNWSENESINYYNWGVFAYIANTWVESLLTAHHNIIH